MIVPKYIREKMHKVAFLHSKAGRLMTEIEDWLAKRGFDTTTDQGLRDGGGCSLDELEYGNDITEELCERIENYLAALEAQKGGEQG